MPSTATSTVCPLYGQVSGTVRRRAISRGARRQGRIDLPNLRQILQASETCFGGDPRLFDRPVPRWLHRRRQLSGIAVLGGDRSVANGIALHLRATRPPPHYSSDSINGAKSNSLALPPDELPPYFLRHFSLHFSLLLVRLANSGDKLQAPSARRRGAAATVEDMGVYHRGLYVAMAQEFLDRSDIVTAFEQVSCERMPESMARGPLRQSGPCDSIFHSFLNQRFVYVMSAMP